MLIRTFFIIDIDRIKLPFKVNLLENEYICFNINNISDFNLTAFLKIIYSSVIETPFCISVNLYEDSETIEKICQKLLPVTFHYKYLYSKFSTPVIGINANDFTGSKSIDFFTQIFQEQGYKDIHFTSMQVIKKNPDNLTETIQSHYEKSITSMRSGNESIFITLDSLKDIFATTTVLNEFEKSLAEKFPQLIYLLKSFNKSEKEKKYLSFHAGMLTQKLESIQNYHPFYNESESEYRTKIKEIVNFYQNEYEILPKWYKRFGHIIKVLTGKRTFRSLFDNKAPKYKQ